jgi:hypothetical protein
MLHGFGSFPGSPWSLSTSKSTGLEPMPLSNQVYLATWRRKAATTMPDAGTCDAWRTAVPRESAAKSLSWAKIYLKKEMPGVTISLCQHRRRRPGNAAWQSNPKMYSTREQNRSLFLRSFLKKITGSSISSNTPCSWQAFR